jgi:TRAP-type C4-dicarboxylate transport system substrate-binding protein
MRYLWTIKVFLTILILSVGMLPGRFARAQAEEPVRLSYASDSPADAVAVVQMKHWKKEVELRTNGQVKVDIHPRGALLTADRMLEGILTGRADIGCLNLTSEPKRFRVGNAVGLPWAVPDARTGSQILLALLNKYGPSAFENLKVLALFTTTPLELITSTAVKSQGEIKGLDIYGSGFTSRFLTAWGANPVGLPFKEVPKALEIKMIKGVLAPIASLKELEYARTCTFVTLLDTAVIPFAVIMNRSSWESLPPVVQGVLDDLVESHSLWTADYLDQRRQESTAWARQTHKVQFIRPEAPQKARWDLSLNSLADTWREQAQAEGLPADGILADIQSFIRKDGRAKPRRKTQ